MLRHVADVKVVTDQRVGEDALLERVLQLFDVVHGVLVLGK